MRELLWFIPATIRSISGVGNLKEPSLSASATLYVATTVLIVLLQGHLYPLTYVEFPAAQLA